MFKLKTFLLDLATVLLLIALIKYILGETDKEEDLDMEMKLVKMFLKRSLHFESTLYLLFKQVKTQVQSSTTRIS